MICILVVFYTYLVGEYSVLKFIWNSFYRFANTLAPTGFATDLARMPFPLEYRFYLTSCFTCMTNSVLLVISYKMQVSIDHRFHFCRVSTHTYLSISFNVMTTGMVKISGAEIQIFFLGQRVFKNRFEPFSIDLLLTRKLVFLSPRNI